MANKKQILDKVNNYKNTPLAPLAKDVLNNTSEGHHKDLMQYNAMLDHITIGAHTNTTINFAGIDWKFRLLTAEEYINIRLEVDKRCREKENFSDYFNYYQTMILILSMALTPSPFKTEGKDIFSEKDLSTLNFDVLEVVYQEYLFFVNLVTQKPTEFSNEQIEALWRIHEKKPEASREFGRQQLLAMLDYATNCLRTLEKITKSVTNNFSS